MAMNPNLIIPSASPLIMAGKKPGDAGEKACSWMEEGQRCAEKGQHEKAIELFDRAIRDNPDSADAWLAKCNELKALERYPEASLVIGQSFGNSYHFEVRGEHPRLDEMAARLMLQEYLESQNHR